MKSIGVKDLIDKLNKARTKSRRKALLAVQAMSLPEKILVSSESFIGLGGRWDRRAQHILESLTETHGDKLPDLMGIALRQCHYAACCAGYFMAETGGGACCNTPETYVQMEGWACTMANGDLAGIEETLEQATFQINTPFVDRISSESLLDCMALYWFSQASDLNQRGDALAAQGFIFEAMDALSLSSGTHMWNGAFEAANEEHEYERRGHREIRSTAGRQGAMKKNEPIRQLKAWALAEASNMRDAQTDIARKLAARLPAQFADVSKSPERLIYDALRSLAKPD